MAEETTENTKNHRTAQESKHTRSEQRMRGVCDWASGLRRAEHAASLLSCCCNRRRVEWPALCSLRSDSAASSSLRVRVWCVLLCGVACCLCACLRCLTCCAVARCHCQCVVCLVVQINRWPGESERGAAAAGRRRCWSAVREGDRPLRAGRLWWSVRWSPVALACSSDRVARACVRGCEGRRGGGDAATGEIGMHDAKGPSAGP